MSAKRPAPRLPVLDEAHMNAAQRALMEAIRSGPRGKSIVPRGPFAVWLHAPEFGQLAQALGGHCRYQTAVPPRLSEFAILCTARLWRAQYEWFAHEPPALAAGVKPKTIQDLRAGRVPKSAAKDGVPRNVQRQILQQIKGKKSENRVESVYELADYPSVDAAKILVQHGLTSKFEEVRKAAYETLVGMVDNQEVCDFLLQTVRKDTSRTPPRETTCALLAAVLAYFGFHAYHGEFGINSRHKLQEQAAELQAQLAAVQGRREAMEKRARLLHDGTIEKDMLDEQARQALNLVKPDEVIVMLPQKAN